jgi:hypothetical protein
MSNLEQRAPACNNSSELAPETRLIWLTIASARLALFEAGEIDLDEACEGLFDHWPFRFACERADAAKQQVDRKTKRLLRMLDHDWSIERVYRALNEERSSNRRLAT